MKWLEYRGESYLNCIGSMPYLAMRSPIIRLVMPRALGVGSHRCKGIVDAGSVVLAKQALREMEVWCNHPFGRDPSRMEKKLAGL